MQHVQRAAEEAQWLIERGYAVAPVSSFVAEQRGLTPDERQLLTCGAAASASYKHHIARELEAEDVARRPLVIDTVSVVATVAAGLRGRLLVESDAGVLCDPGWSRGAPVDAGGAFAALEVALKAARPKSVQWLVDSSHPSADALLAAAAKVLPKKSDVSRLEDVPARLVDKPFVASSDPDVLDRVGTWFNLVAAALEGASAPRVRL